MRNFTRFAVLCAVLSSLGACGLHLRSSLSLPDTALPVVVTAHNASAVSMRLHAALLDAGIPLGKAQCAAPAQDEASPCLAARTVVQLDNEQVERRVLSVSGVTGKQEEIELIHSVTLEVRDGAGKVLAAPRRLRAAREFTYAQDAVLATGAEEEMLRRELAQDLLAEVMRILRVVARDTPIS